MPNTPLSGACRWTRQLCDFPNQIKQSRANSVLHWSGWRRIIPIQMLFNSPAAQETLKPKECLWRGWWRRNYSFLRAVVVAFRVSCLACLRISHLSAGLSWSAKDRGRCPCTPHHSPCWSHQPAHSSLLLLEREHQTSGLGRRHYCLFICHLFLFQVLFCATPYSWIKFQDHAHTWTETDFSHVGLTGPVLPARESWQSQSRDLEIQKFHAHSIILYAIFI